MGRASLLRSGAAASPRPRRGTPRLRVFSGGGDPPTAEGAGGGCLLSPDMAVDEFFDRWFSPYYLDSPARNLKPATKREYRTAVDRWVELIGRPPFRAITSADCRTFRDLDMGRPGRRGGKLNHWTVRKHCTALRVIFAAAGPTTQANPETAVESGLWGLDGNRAPRLPPVFPRIKTPPPSADDVFSVDEIRALWLACERMTLPRLAECTAVEWWRALLLFLYNSGLRIAAAVQARRSMVRSSDGANWIAIPGRISKGGRSADVPLSAHALLAIASISTGDLIFPWPHSMSYLHATRRSLLTAADIAPDRRFGFHALRGATGTELWQIDPDAAQQQLGHKDRRTTSGHYVSQDVQAASKAKRLAAALDKLPQPNKDPDPPPKPSPQRALFDKFAD